MTRLPPASSALTEPAIAARETAVAELLASVREPAGVARALAASQGEGPRAGRTRDGFLRALGAPAGAYFPVASALPSDPPEVVATRFLTEWAAAFGPVAPALTFERSSVQARGAGTTVRLAQMIDGVPVFGAQVVVALNGAQGVEAVLADLSSRAERAGEGARGHASAASEERARRRALEHVHRGSRANLAVSEPVLAVFDPEVVGSSGATQLVWQLEVVGDDGAVDEVVLVSVATGEVAFHVSRVPDAKQREIYDASNSATASLARTEGQPPSAVADVNSAYDYLGDVYDFFFLHFGRDGLDGAGGKLTGVVRACPTGEACPYHNTYWSAPFKAAVFGEGYAAADDVVGHEAAHGLTQAGSNLIYWGESGAISESLSDIFGELIDLENGHGMDLPWVRWLIGEDLPGGLGPLRNMSNPPAFNQPDRRFSGLWYNGSADSRGVHTNSGVGNKLAYLLTDGGTFHGKTVAGMGTARVAALFYDVDMSLLVPASDYIDLYWALTQAASDLGWTPTERANLEAACEAAEIATSATTGSGAADVFSDGFEGAFPGTWSVYDLSPTHTQWGRSTFKSSSGVASAWCAAGGTGAQSPGGSYVPAMDTWLVSPSFSLADATDAWLEFDLFLDTGGVNDALSWYVGTDLQHAYLGSTVTTAGSGGACGTTGGWVHEVFNFRSVTEATILGQSQLLVGFRFQSDGATECDGAYVDNVVVRKVTAGSCSYSIDPTSRAVDNGPGSGSIAVLTGAGCAWQALANDPWLTVTAGASGSGDGTVEYSVAANGGPARTGTLAVAGQTFTVSQAAAACSYELAPIGASFTAAAGGDTVAITTNLPTCAWIAASNDAWISITSSASGTGSGSVNYSVAANSALTPRSGTMTIAGQTFTVDQAAAPCTYSILPTSASYPAAGGGGSVTVNAGEGCAWTAASNAAWLAVTAGASGSGGGTVSYTVAANASSLQRSGTLTIAGKTFTVTQTGVPCSYLVAPTTASFGSGAALGSVSVTAPEGCPWSAVSNTAWITITDGASGSGNGTISYSVASNAGGSQRTGTLTAASQTVTVFQSGACPELAGQLPGGVAWAVALSGNLAFVANGDAGLRVVSLADPSHPSEVGVVDTPGSANGVAVSGNLVYVADAGSGLRIVDVSDPAHPVEVGAYDTPGSAQGVAVSGSFAYVADGSSGLLVINVADPAHPVEAGAYDTPWYAYDVALAGSYAFVADSASGLRIVNIADPAHPIERGSYNTPGTAEAVAVAGSYAYVADLNKGLRVISVADPVHPTEVGFFQTTGSAYGVALTEGFAFVADGSAGLRILDISAPQNPTEVGSYDSPGTSYGILVSGSTAYLADGSGGLDVLGLAGCGVLGAGIEADVVPTSSGGDGWVREEDRQRVGQFVARLAVPTPGGEYRKADCAPREALGDGHLTVIDWVQAGRYAAGLDPATTAGGPASESAAAAAVMVARAAMNGARVLSIADTTIPRGQSGTLAVTLAAQGDENAVAFSLAFDPALLSFSGATLGGGASAATLLLNDASKASGLVGIALALPAGQSFAAGSQELVLVSFTVATGTSSASTTCGFGDQPVPREVASAAALPLGASYDGADLTLPPWGTSAQCTGDPGLFFAAAAHTAGVNNTLWRTDLDFVNPTPDPATLDILLFKANQANPQPQIRSVTIPAGRATRFGDVLATMFTAANAALGVRVCTGQVGATSRFYNTGSADGSTYGMRVPAMLASQALGQGQLGVLQNLSYSTDPNAGFRSNIGFVNASAFSVRVVIKLYGDAGELLGTKTHTLLAYEHRQFTKIHEDLETPPVNAGFATVEVQTAGGQVHPYAMLIDNRSGDPIYIPVSIW